MPGRFPGLAIYQNRHNADLKGKSGLVLLITMYSVIIMVMLLSAAAEMASMMRALMAPQNERQ